MRKVIGYEGTRDDSLGVSWGPAAIDTGKELENGAAGLRQPLTPELVQSLVSDGAITLLDGEIEVRHFDKDAPLVVELSHAFLSEIGAAKWHTSPSLRGRRGTLEGESRVAVVFADEPSFDAYRVLLLNRLIERVIYERPEQERRTKYIQAALVLDTHSPAANALEAFYDEDQEFAFEFACSNVRGEKSLGELNRVFAALKAARAADHFAPSNSTGDSDKVDYFVRYRDGIASSGGGLSIHDALKLVRSVAELDEFSKQKTKGFFPFIQEAPTAHLQAIAEGSAILHFSSAVEGESFGQRVARFLSLSVLQEVIEGRPEQLEKKQNLLEAHRVVVKPTPATHVQHKGIGDPEFRQIEADAQSVKKDLPAPTGPRTSEPLVVLGYQSGLLDEWGKLQINIFPGKRILLSANESDLKRAPDGVDVLKSRKDFLFRPALFQLVRVRTGYKRRYWLRSVTLLEDGAQGVITAMPSNFVDDAFVYRLNMPVKNEGGHLVIEGIDKELRRLVIGARELSRAQEWMRAYHDLCEVYELADVRRSRLAPIVMPRPTAFQRVLVVLHEQKRDMSPEEIVAAVDQQFLRDQVLSFRPMLRAYDKFIRLRSGAIYLTEDGERLARAYLAVEARGISARRR